MSDVNIIEEYRALMAIVVNEEMTDNDRLVLIKLLAEMRAGYTAGMWVEEKATGVEQAPSKVRLVWGMYGSTNYLAPVGADIDGAYYGTSLGYAVRFPLGGDEHDRRVPVDSLAHGLRVTTDMARADGYECDEHPDAAPATTTDAPTLPPGPTAEDGWIAWGGGECPCRDWPEVEYMLSIGHVATAPPLALAWGPALSGYNIVAYRRPR